MLLLLLQCPVSFVRKVSILRDTLRLLGNARNGHKHLFFKFQDATTLNLVRKRARRTAGGGGRGRGGGW